MELSGNKVRKLEFLMADAVTQDADCVITISGIQSNHFQATAVAAKYVNLDCYLVLVTSKVSCVPVSEIDKTLLWQCISFLLGFGGMFSASCERRSWFGW